MNATPSQAPKERVNIAYKSATGGRSEEIELPLKLLVLGDMTGREERRPVEEREIVRLDPHNFDAAMASFDLSCNVTLGHPSHDDAPSTQVTLRFGALKDFEPEQLCRQVEPLARLLELRRALVALKGPLGNMPAFRKKLETLLHDPALREQLLTELSAARASEEDLTAH